MTCIVGFVDKEKGITYLGGDSLASDGWTGQIIKERKVFKLLDTSNAILGFSGSVRDLNLLQYAENLIDFLSLSTFNYLPLSLICYGVYSLNSITSSFSVLIM
jgi:ATP-dependent protease HslVU (ClpYQ) peptidase subunit